MNKNNYPKLFKQYQPLLLLLAVIVAIIGIWQTATDTFSLLNSMRLFLGVLLVVAGIFKMWDWHGFVQSFIHSDILARKSLVYAYIYPILQFALGIGYIFDTMPKIVNLATAILMFISSVSVVVALLDKTAIYCACFGTTLQLPLTWLTVIESSSMWIMALIMFFMHL